MPAETGVGADGCGEEAQPATASAIQSAGTVCFMAVPCGSAAGAVAWGTAGFGANIANPRAGTAMSHSVRHPRGTTVIFRLQVGGTVYIPLAPNGCGRSSGVEHYLAKVRVVSSNLIARSKISIYNQCIVLCVLTRIRLTTRRSERIVSIL